MDNPKVFLLSMDIGGIKNLEKPVHISFYNETITNNFDPSKYRLKGIYGENGVGKSALMLGIFFYKELLTNSNFLSLTINDDKMNYLINKRTNKMILSSEFIFCPINKTIIYKHSIELVKNSKNLFEIEKEEVMMRTPSSTYKRVCIVRNGKLEFEDNDPLNKFIIENTKNTLKNRTIISSVISNDEINALAPTGYPLKDIYYCGLLLYVYINTNDRQNGFVAREHLKNNNSSIQDIIPSIALNYLSCEDRIIISYKQIDKLKKYVKELKKFIKIYKPDLKDIVLDEKQDRNEVSCGLVFVYQDYSIYGAFESNGIKKLVELFIAIKAVTNGLIVFIDELDANIHDYYLCRLLEYVAEYTDGQLCFTSHNLGPMEVLKEYKKSIDFLSRDGEIVPWVKNGNYNVANQYKEGKIKNFPFNIESFDFIKVFGDDK